MQYRVILLLALPLVIAPAPSMAQQHVIPVVPQAESDRITAGVVRHIQRQIVTCLELPAGHDRPLPRMRIALNRDGSLVEPPVTAESAPDAVDDAVTLRLAIAIIRCAPFKGLDRFRDSYDRWKNLILRPDIPAPRKDGSTVLRGEKLEHVAGNTTRNGSLSAGPFMALNRNCTVTGQARAWLIRAPQAGKIVMTVRKGEATFQPGHVLSHCNGRTLPGATVVYQPRRDFTGEDSFRFGLRFPDGERRVLNVVVRVR